MTRPPDRIGTYRTLAMRLQADPSNAALQARWLEAATDIADLLELMDDLRTLADTAMFEAFMGQEREREAAKAKANQLPPADPFPDAGAWAGIRQH